MSTTYHRLRSIVCLGAIVAAVFLHVSEPVYAATYTFAGKTFASYAAYQAYVDDYMRAWREVYGTDSTQETVRTSTQQVSATVKSRVSVKTERASSVEKDRVTFEGHVDLSRSSTARVWFEYGTRSTALTDTTLVQTVKRVDGEHFDKRVIGLESDTTYYYRAVAEDPSGRRAYGTVRSVRTDIDEENLYARATVRTDRARDVKHDRATLSARITWESRDESRASLWFVYGESPTDLDKKTNVIVVDRALRTPTTVLVRGLDDKETYYARAVVRDSFGEVDYGGVIAFTTPQYVANYKPDVEITTIDSVTDFSARIRSTVSMNDAEKGIVFILYGEDAAAIRDVPTAYSRYTSIRERGDKLQKVLLDERLGSTSTYETTILDLDPNTRIYIAIGVEYYDEFENRRLMIGYVDSFSTERSY